MCTYGSCLLLMRKWFAAHTYWQLIPQLLEAA